MTFEGTPARTHAESRRGQGKPRETARRYMPNRDRRIEYTGVVRPVLDYLNSLPGGKAINIHGSPFSERGTPDVIGCINGRLVAFECKRDEKEEPTPIQKWRLSEWIAAGAVVGGVSDLWQVQMILCLMGVLDN